MCGISGILNSDPREAEPLVRRMAQGIRHRGPDGDGFFVREPMALGHRRLSIIDLEGGRQPLCNEDESVWVTFNGEIYNYRELRRELENHGHRFRTESDTEVIVHAWEQWGEACVNRLRGMFAFGVADWNRRELFLARDHLGIKPLYFMQRGAMVAFASELQGLTALPQFGGEIDPRALDNYLFLGYVPPPRTIYADVSKLPPGHCMTVGFDGRTNGLREYWRLRFVPEEDRTFEEWAEEFEAVLRESVRAHLVADVPFGAFLSGGLDSTAIVGMMSQELATPVRTFSIGFEEETFSEVRYARQVARHWNTEHHEEIVRPDALAILPDLVRHYGEPFGDSSAVPTYYVSRLARRHVPMVLTGDGGDEALFGYGRYAGWARWINPGRKRRVWWKRMLRPGLRVAMPGRFGPDTLRREARMEDWLTWMGTIKSEMRRGLWRPEYMGHVDQPMQEFEAIRKDAAELPAEAFGQYVDYRSYLPHDILTKVDIASMYHGLETRTPLVDVNVAEFSARVPWHMHVRQDEEGSYSGKQLLKRILRRDFPEEFVERRKMGFGVPLCHWFDEPKAGQEMRERLGRASSPIYEFLRPDAVRKLLANHSAADNDHSTPLWQLLVLDEWLTQHRSRTSIEDMACV